MASTVEASYGAQIIAPPNNSVTMKSEDAESSTVAPSNLTAKLAGDAVIGTGVTFLVAPFLTVVDKAIAQRAAGTNTFANSCHQSLRMMVTNPVAFVRNPAFLYMWGVYAATYTTANSLKTLVEHQKQSSAGASVKSHQDADALGTIGIFLGTSAANSAGSLIKDRAYARMYSADAAAAVARKVPMASYGVWMSRDLIGIGSSFVLPDMIARKLSESNPEDEKRNRDISQFCVPIATQFVAGPLHLLGLDVFNRPMQDLSWRQTVLDRSKFLMTNYASVVTARVARIIPGYGFGGVFNTRLRDGWREYLVQRDADPSSLRESFGIPSGLSSLKKAPMKV